MGKKLLLFLLIVPFFLQAQSNIDDEHRTFFSEVIDKNIRKFRKSSKRAYANQDLERARFLFDSLVENVIVGSYMDDFPIKKISGRKINLHDFKKPIYLITYASWCTPGVGEIPALNEIAEKYYTDIDFVVLFWDDRKDVRKRSKKYSKHITVIYVNEREKNMAHVVRKMKHSIGFPTQFFINSDKKILDVRRGVSHHCNAAYTDSYNLNYNSLMSGVSVVQTSEVTLNK